jgi:uncharacterized protein DUF5335
MQTREIPNEQWTGFLDHFSEQHRGDAICVQVMTKETGVQSEARDLPLMGISNDYKASGGQRIEVVAGDSPHKHVMHSVSHPIHVRIAERDDGEPVAMQIQSDDGQTTLIRFGHEPQPLPEGMFTC